MSALPSDTRKPRVAFVVQRCGLEVNGGAELHCLQLAQRMAKWWETEVLTTCALDYMRWENSYPPGVAQAGETSIRRFPVDSPRDVESFDRFSGELQARQLQVDLETQEKWMRAQGPLCTPLLEYLRAQADAYDAFIFFGYLYATTYFGIPLVAKKAYLAPLAHDEWPIYLSMWERIFSLPKKFIFNTETEREFIRGRFPMLPVDGSVVGVGIDEPQATKPLEFRARYSLDGPFLLYVGRVDQSKGCATLVDHFIRAREAGVIQQKLILIGQEIMPIPFHDDIIHLGFVTDEEKWNAMAACDWLVVPSPHESLSMVLLETWAVGKPVVVNAECKVLREHCVRSNGGLWYENYEEWVAIVSTVAEDQKRALGEHGRAYVQSQYSWERVEADYLRLVTFD